MISACRVQTINFPTKPFCRKESPSELVEKNMGLARRAAIPFVRSGNLVDSEAYSDALLGLWHAARKWDASCGILFSTYATHCCRNRVINGEKRRMRQNQVEEFPEDFDPPETSKSNHVNLNLLQLFLRPIASDTEKERLRKRVLYDHYVLRISWEEIGKKLRVTRNRAWQLGQEGIKLIKMQFASLIESEV